MVYISAGKEVKLDLDLCGWETGRSWWFNCKKGTTELIGSIEMKGRQSFKPVTRFRGNDCVLVIGNAVSDYDALVSKYIQ